MSKHKVPTHNPRQELGYGQQRIQMGLVVNNKDDPEKAGRVQLRILGEQQDEAAVPDKNLIWGRPLHPTTSAALKGMGTSARLVPGSTVLVMMTGGPDSQDYIILGSMGRGGMDDKSDTHPAVHGAGATHKDRPSPKRRKDAGWSQGKLPSEITSTREAKKEIKQASQREEDKIHQGQKKEPIPNGQRNSARYLGDSHASLGSGMLWDQAQNPATQIKGQIQNKSAAVDSFLPMIEQLKKVTSGQNPDHASSVGAGNLLGALKQIGQLFPKKKKKKQPNEEEEPLTEEELALETLLEKLTQRALEEIEENNNNGTS